MLAKLTTLASDYGSGSWASSLEASTEYLFNTKNITSAKTHNTADTEFRYVFEPSDRQSAPEIIRVDEASSAIAAEANYDASAATQDSAWITLNVYEDDDTAGSTTAYYIPQDAITFGETYSDANITSKARIWVNEGGFSLKRYIVNHTIAAIETLAQAT